MTVIDPLAPSMVPAADRAVEELSDAPRDPSARPFGLTMTTQVPSSQIDHIDGVTYDPSSQLSVTDDGTPLYLSPLEAASISTRNTTADMQHYPDKEADD